MSLTFTRLFPTSSQSQRPDCSDHLCVFGGLPLFLFRFSVAYSQCLHSSWTLCKWKKSELPVFPIWESLQWYPRYLNRLHHSLCCSPLLSILCSRCVLLHQNTCYLSNSEKNILVSSGNSSTARTFNLPVPGVVIMRYAFWLYSNSVNWPILWGSFSLI